MTVTAESTHTQYLTLLLGDDLYALPLGAVKDIRASGGAQPLHGVPAYVKGRLAHPLGSLPLVDLRARIGHPAATGEVGGVTVVIERAGALLAVHADAVAEVVDLGIADEPPTGTPDQPDVRADLAWLKGAAAAGEKMVLMLDADQLIAGADRAAVHAALADAQTAQAA
ncbi:chemotaxis protein CheW [Dyella sp.]|uniref:chemotaxis protein CheW n=1 Tax=Dyella sp. TaxID=1869338 RepID=UPI002D7984EC|nr:chemotaxis protein CheW [Dyella sp.]HET6431093.1 chemotaxis protein CheW [Dyella sp.]